MTATDTNSRSFNPSNRRAQAGLTLLEAVLAILILAIGTASALTALTTLNTYSIINRNRVAALAVLQSRVEEFLSEPFTGNATSGPLMIGTRSEIVPIVTVTSNNSTQTWLSGNLVTTVSDASRTIGGNNLRLLRASFSLTHTYRGRTYTLTQSTLRANDQ